MPNQKERINLGIAGPDYTSSSRNVNTQTLINYYMELDLVGGKNNITNHPTPGTSFVASAEAGAVRGVLKFKDNVYWVVGSALVKMNSEESFTTVGNINTNSGLVSIATNGQQGNQLMIVDGTDGWLYNGTTLTRIDDVDFPLNPAQVVFIDSYFIVVATDDPKFYLSSLNDGEGWNALDFATAERDPDNIASIIPNERELWLLGDDTAEIWTNTGGELPFEPYNTGFSESGCAARFSVAKANGSVIWLSNDKRGRGRIYKSEGLRYKVVSSHAFEHAVSKYKTIDDAFAFTYFEDGHTFYQITFPSENVTWVYDLEIPDTNLAWHRRETAGGRHVASAHVFYRGTHYVGDRSEGNVLRMSTDIYTDSLAGITKRIYRERTGKNMFVPGNKRVKYQNLEFEFQMGTGTTGIIDEPFVSVDWSDDHGYTWKNTRKLSLGKVGQYKKRALIKHAGMARNRIFRIRSDEITPIIIINAYADTEIMAH